MMQDVPFALNHLRWLVAPEWQEEVLLRATTTERLTAFQLMAGNEAYCGTVVDDDGLPYLCSGIYEFEDHGAAWTFFHEDMRHCMVYCVRTVRRGMRRFFDLTGKPIYATVDEDNIHAVRWAKAVGLKPIDGTKGTWWASKQHF